MFELIFFVAWMVGLVVLAIYYISEGKALVGILPLAMAYMLIRELYKHITKK